MTVIHAKLRHKIYCEIYANFPNPPFMPYHRGLLKFSMHQDSYIALFWCFICAVGHCIGAIRGREVIFAP